MALSRSSLFKSAQDSAEKGAARLPPFSKPGFSMKKALRESDFGGTPDAFHGTDTTGLPQVARDINELQGQISALISAFHSSENRLPTPEDSEFWTAYKTLVERYSESYVPPKPSGATT